jgi:hypothetical protein
MTQEEKDLLLKDLSGRLGYGIKVWEPNGTGGIVIIKGIVGNTCYFETNPVYGNSCAIDNVKPYLRPMSSMTKEEKEVYINTFLAMWDAVDWLNEHHFDFRGLIEKGLALEAPEGMYKTE